MLCLLVTTPLSAFVPSSPAARFAYELRVSLRKQRLYVWSTATRAAIRTIRVSTGKPGHRTPAGDFTVLAKNRYTSSLPEYGGETLEYGVKIRKFISFHAYGSVPRHPASHGCLRERHADARYVFGIARIGMRVLITAD